MATITSATSGASNVTGTWTGGVVPVSGDKVIIAHPGTNTLASTPYTLNGAASLGATTIPVTGGSGTIVAGECVQLEHQTGTDEYGQPIYDNTYYTVTTGITGAGSLVITPGLAYAMASGVRVVNRGHVVTLDASHTWGDDTRSLTAASNGIEVRGTIRASRTTTQTLTVRGSMFINAGGAVDYGAPGIDPIPAAVVATCLLGNSAAPAAGRDALTSHGSNSPTFRACGKFRKRNTTLTASASAGATSISVEDSTGWEVGDRLIISSDTTDPARVQVVTITGGSAPNWTVSAITNARASGTLVGNLSSNVVFGAASAANPACLAIYNSSASTTALARVAVANVRFENIGHTSGWVGLANNPAYYGGIGVVNAIGPAISIPDCASESTSAASTGGGPTTYLANQNRISFDRWAIFGGSSSNGTYFGGNSTATLKNSVIYRAATAFRSAFDGGSVECTIENCESWSSSTAITSNSTSFKIAGGNHRAVTRIMQNGVGSLDVENAVIESDLFALAASAASSGVTNFRNVTFVGASLSATLTGGQVPSQNLISRLIAVNGVVDDNRVRSYYQETATDTTTRKRSTYSVKIQPRVANTAIQYIITLPGVAGVAQTIKGALRFDATYGTATPPSIALSGQGVSASFTAPATADAWHDFTLSFTPTSTGDITATVTVQSASTSGFAWLDGVYHYPMTQTVRHFGFQFLPQTALVADSRITLPEAAALALPVSVNHGTSTITVSANATAREVFEACIADLCQTANIGQAVHIESATGATFSTTYTVALTGGAAITGAYTDAAGLHVNIRADNLLSGTRVRVFNVTDSTELYNDVTASAGFVLPIIAPGSAKTIQLRAAKVGYLPIEVEGLLDGASLSFLDSQAFDTVYLANAIDGSTVTGLTPDYPNLQIDANIAGGGITVQAIYAWTRWANTDADGIRLMHNVVQAQDGANYLIDTAVVNARFDNNSATPLVISGGYIRRSDGLTVIGEGAIQLDPGRAYVAAGAAAITVPSGEKVVTLASTGGYLARG